jgi:hypothetical protein
MGAIVSNAYDHNHIAVSAKINIPSRQLRGCLSIYEFISPLDFFLLFFYLFPIFERDFDLGTVGNHLSLFQQHIQFLDFCYT